MPWRNRVEPKELLESQRVLRPPRLRSLNVGPLYGYMTNQQAVGFLICSLWIASGVADPEISSAAKKTACSVELSRFKSPHAYLVAIVEGTAQPQCNDNDCTQSLAIVRVLMAGDRSAQLTSIDVGYSLKTRDNGGHYTKGKTVGVFVPAPDGKLFWWLTETVPADPTVIAEYEQAVEIVGSSPTGTPHCEKSAP